MRGKFLGGHGKDVKGGRSLLRYGPLLQTKTSLRDKNHVAILATTLYGAVFHVTMKGGRDWLRGLRLHRFVLGDHCPHVCGSLPQKGWSHGEPFKRERVRIGSYPQEHIASCA